MPRPDLSNVLDNKALDAVQAAGHSARRARPTPASPPKGVKPSRVGKVGLTVHVDPAVRRQLKVLAAERDATVHGLVCEALNLLFAEHSRPESAQ